MKRVYIVRHTNHSPEALTCTEAIIQHINRRLDDSGKVQISTSDKVNFLAKDADAVIVVLDQNNLPCTQSGQFAIKNGIGSLFMAFDTDSRALENVLLVYNVNGSTISLRATWLTRDIATNTIWFNTSSTTIRDFIGYIPTSSDKESNPTSKSSKRVYPTSRLSPCQSCEGVNCDNCTTLNTNKRLLLCVRVKK